MTGEWIDTTSYTDTTRRHENHEGNLIRFIPYEEPTES